MLRFTEAPPSISASSNPSMDGSSILSSKLAKSIVAETVGIRTVDFDPLHLLVRVQLGFRVIVSRNSMA